MDECFTLEDHLERMGKDGSIPAWRRSQPRFNQRIKECIQKGNSRIYYPGASCDESLLKWLEKAERSLDDVTVIYQDTYYSKHEGCPDCYYGDRIVDHLEELGVTVISGRVQGDEIPEKADLVYMRHLFRLLLMNDMAENILKNTKEGTLITGRQADIAVLALCYSGLDVISPDLVEASGEYEQTSFYRMYEKFDVFGGELLCWLSGHGRGEGYEFPVHTGLTWEIENSEPEDVEELEAFLGKYYVDTLKKVQDEIEFSASCNSS